MLILVVISAINILRNVWCFPRPRRHPLGAKNGGYIVIN